MIDHTLIMLSQFLIEEVYYKLETAGLWTLRFHKK